MLDSTEVSKKLKLSMVVSTLLFAATPSCTYNRFWTGTPFCLPVRKVGHATPRGNTYALTLGTVLPSTVLVSAHVAMQSPS